MHTFLDVLVILLVLTNFRLLGSARLAACIQTLSLQAVVLCALPLAMHWPNVTVRLAAFSAAVLAVKGLLLPWLLRRAAREGSLQREVQPMIGFSGSILVGAALLGLCFVFVGPLMEELVGHGGLELAGSLFTLLTGLLMIVSRRSAIAQVLGYLAMENGVYAFGAALAIEEPLLVEMGVLLDVLVAVFVMGIAIFHISREFDDIDTDRLSALKG